jgi:hypothetical protein
MLMFERPETERNHDCRCGVNCVSSGPDRQDEPRAPRIDTPAEVSSILDHKHFGRLLVATLP